MGNGVVNATDNWWGSNTPTVSSTNGSDIYIAKGTVTYTPWLVLNINSTDGTPDVTADLTTDNNGNNTSSNGTLPDGIPINFNTTLGTIGTTSYTSKGKATSTLNANNTYSIATVSVTLDNQTVSKTILTYNIYDITTQKGFTTIQDALNDSSTSNGDIIKLENGTYNGLGNVNLTINKNVTIIGSGSTIIDSQGSGQAFIISSNVNATISDITFINGNMGSTGAGGAICNGGTLNVIGCTFKNNTAFNGGAVVNGGTLTVTNSTFISNTAGHDGAALNNLNTLTVINCNFLNNSASHVAGGIMNWHGTLNVTGSSFTGNTATTEGSAISNYGPANINFNRIVGNGNYQLYNANSAAMNATNNWWGQNNGPVVSSTSPSDIYMTSGTVTYDPWLVLNVSSNDNVGGTSDVSVDLTHDNHGNDTSPAGNIPDGVPVNFTTTFGTIVNTTFVNKGKTVSHLDSNATHGTANVSVTVDKQTVSKTIYLNGIYDIITQNGFANLQSAINDNSTMNGDIIEIENGTYNENIVVNKSLTIMSVPGDNVTFQASNPNLPVFTIDSNGTGSDLENLIITGSTNSHGIYIHNSSNNTVSGSIISNNQNGIYLENSSNNTISGSIISNNSQRGMFLIGYSNNNTISDNNVTNNYNGIEISRGFNNTISSNIISNNQYCGVYTFDDTVNVNSINFNRIIQNSWYGIYDEYGTVNATNNWWGTNSPNVGYKGDISIEDGTLYYDPWIVLSVNSSTDRSNRNGTMYNYLVTADLTHNNHGNDTSADGNIPDDTQINFSTTIGTIDNASTINGKTIVTLNNTSVGMVDVSATLDNQTITLPINVTSVNDLGIYNNRTGEGFSTIQSAIDSTNTINGDTITLAEGTYTENVIVHKQVNLKPDSGANVIIQAVDPTYSVFTITSAGSGSTIQGFTIIGATNSTGICLNSSNNCNITGNTINNNQIGIYLNNSSNNIINTNKIENNFEGIYLDSSLGNIISRNIIKNNFEGVYLESSNNNILTENNVTSNWDGIFLYNSNSTLSGNNINENSFGIYFYDSNSTIYGNNVTENWNGDISQIDSTGIVMSTTYYNCGPASLATVLNKMGINTTQEELATLAGTDITGTTMYGLAQAAQAKGLIAKGMKLSVNQLRTDNIVFLTINGEGHYSIIKNITNTTVYLADSDLGNINMTLDNFTAAYLVDGLTGYALSITNDLNDPQLGIGTTLTITGMQNLVGSGTHFYYKYVGGYWYKHWYKCWYKHPYFYGGKWHSYVWRYSWRYHHGYFVQVAYHLPAAAEALNIMEGVMQDWYGSNVYA